MQIMKLVCSFTLSFLLFAFITNLSLAFSNDDGRYIIDTNFNPVHPYSSYYITPSIFNIRSGKLKLVKTGDSNCPVTVFEDFNAGDRGTPVKFIVSDKQSDDILTGTPIEIEFTKKPDCVESSKWLIFIDNVINKFCVGIGGPENYPGMQIVNGTFKIKKYGFSYKFVFCVDGSSSFCSDIGYYNSQGGGRLILADELINSYVFTEAYSYEDGVIESVS